MLRRFLLVSTGLALCTVSPVIAQCGVFSGIQGVDGFYAGYREGSGPFRLMTQTVPFGPECSDWYVDRTQFATHIGVCFTQPNGANTLPLLRSTPQEAVIRYVAPRSGHYVALVATSYFDYTCDSGTSWVLRHNETVITGGTVGGSPCDYDFRGQVDMAANDSLELGIRSGTGAAECDRITYLFEVNAGNLTHCIADYDNGTRSGYRDNAVTLDDLLFYLELFEVGDARADLWDGVNLCVDGAVTIDDLLGYLQHFIDGC